MDDPHEVTFNVLGRPLIGVMRMISKREIQPTQFLDIGSACLYARREAESIKRRAIIEVIEKRTGRTKLRIELDGRGGIVEIGLV